MKHYDYEEEFHKNNRKDSKKRRKQAQNTDRSKYKKTDASKPTKETSVKDTHKGKVLSISGEGSVVDFEGKQYICSLKGFLKKDKSLSKNLIAVGDLVSFTISSKTQGAIVRVEPRRSILSRIDISGKKEQLIAVNVDIAVICVSVSSPPLKPPLIDRYLIAAEKGNLEPLIVINKIDLLPKAKEAERELYEAFLLAYMPLGIPILLLSTKTGVGIEDLITSIQNKTSVFSGQSGVGKSTILNVAFDLTLKTGKLTQKTDKGAHTTTRAELLTLPNGGYCVDTPGIRSFGLWDLKKEDIRTHFTEFTSKRRKQCKFPDCTHTQEPDCSVLRAVKRGTISLMRYESYLTLFAEADQQTKKTTWS